MITSKSNGDSAAPSRKRNLFKNRPTWAKVDASVAPAPIDFSRSNDTYARLEKEKEELRDKDKNPKQKKERAMDVDGQRSTKRRRTIESGDDEASASEMSSVKPTSKDSRSPSTPKRHGKSTRRDPIVINVDDTSDEEGTEAPRMFWSPITAKEILSQPLQNETAGEHQTSSESESERLGRQARERITRDEQRKHDVRSLPAAPKEPTPQPQPNDMYEVEPTGSDAEYEKLAKEARERLKCEAHKNSGAQQPTTPPIPADKSLPTPTSAKPASKPASDLVIRLFIHSRIPNTTPLIVHIRLSQRLKEVRIAWLTRQLLTNTQKDEVFFTWRQNRVFDFTTCKSLGVNVDEDGEVYIKGQTQLPGTDSTQLEMEATTREIWEDDRKPKDRPPDTEQLAADIPSIKIILKAKGLEDYKLVVKPTTKFRQIASVFRRVRGIVPDKTLSLVFDGERLGEEEEMQNSEVADMDNIEVHIK